MLVVQSVGSGKETLELLLHGLARRLYARVARLHVNALAGAAS